VYSVYASSISATETTVTSLTPGVTYSFLVQARNVIGLSSYSDPISELAAQIPDEPTDLADALDITLAT
jgi:hypothetical protein